MGASQTLMCMWNVWGSCLKCNFWCTSPEARNSAFLTSSQVWGPHFWYQGHKQQFPALFFLQTFKNSSPSIFICWPCFLPHWENRSIWMTHIIVSAQLSTSAPPTLSSTCTHRWNICAPIQTNPSSVPCTTSMTLRTFPLIKHTKKHSMGITSHLLWLTQGHCFGTTRFCIIIFFPHSWFPSAWYSSILISLNFTNRKLIPFP